MKLAPTYQKLRGGYYTPKPIADFLAQWAIQGSDVEILEPSCGDGSLVEASIEALLARGARKEAIAQLIHGVEIDPDEAARTAERMRALGISPSEDTIHVGDFFAHCQAQLFEQHFMGVVASDTRKFDVVIGNPPFIRYQNFPEASRDIACGIMRQVGLHPTKLLNAWLPFLIASTLLLKEHGRLAMVIPAELFQVNYAAETRQFLSDFYDQITIVTFKKLVFYDIQQEVVLLLCEKNNHHIRGVRTFELEDAEELTRHNHSEFSESDFKPMDHSKEKWTQYFLDADEIALLRSLRSHSGITLSGSVIKVDVGVVTGENKFFILNEKQVQNAELEPFTQKIVSRSAHLKGALFSEEDWQVNTTDQVPTYLLMAPNVPREELSDPLRAYVLKGEEANYHTGYKCRIRSPWYTVPSVWNPEAFMLRQIHGYPKLILNQAEATCTDTIHRVRFSGPLDKRFVVAAFMNVLTFAFAEVTGRGYGGGVLTFEPSEAEKLPLPLVGVENLDLDEFDRLLRAGGIEAVLARTDEILLKRGLGLSDKEVRMLHNIWVKMRDRRVYRKHKSSK
ncbi:MAG TPA: N-6 DNA methylase [Ktedonobacteraceae bacterium]|nr:N-6 DNA methylase [Ktedonobacteraceae bacterium]